MPVSYLVCERDLIIPPTFQREMIEMVARESGREVDVHVCQGDHCVNLSKPDAFVEAVRKAAGEDVEGKNSWRPTTAAQTSEIVAA